MKNAIKKIPVIGPALATMYRKLKGQPSFKHSSTYWEKRYEKGGNSGAGSYSKLAEFKAEVLNEFVIQNKINSVIELGCGDGNQLQYFNFPKYTGFDVSATVVNLCTEKYKNDDSKAFKTIDNIEGYKADLSISLDVIYHLVEDDIFHIYMEQLFGAATKHVIVYSSNDDDHENNGITPHVRHRNFTNWIEKHQPQFKLTKHLPNKYPYNGVNEVSSYADFYFFEKQ